MANRKKGYSVAFHRGGRLPLPENDQQPPFSAGILQRRILGRGGLVVRNATDGPSSANFGLRRILSDPVTNRLNSEHEDLLILKK